MNQKLVTVLKTMADETRLRIIHLIDQCGPDLCVCDMVAVLGLPQSTISRQLMRLRHLGIVTDSRDGMWINYSMNSALDANTHQLMLALQACWANDKTFMADKKKFYSLHAANKIVRCKRGAGLSDVGVA